MKLLILVSTFGPDALNRVSRLVLPPREEVHYLVSWQTGFTQETSAADRETIDKMLENCPLTQREDVLVSVVDGRGLSVNRNRTIDMAVRCPFPEESEDDVLLWFMDDDVTLLPEGIDAILKSFGENPVTGGGTFQILTPEGSSYKRYEAVSKPLRTVGQLRNVSSIEIVLRRSCLKKKPIRFDERFGIGAQWVCSEEFLFMVACLRAGMTLRSFPYAVAVHPKYSSVNGRSQMEEEMVRKSGAVNAVLYGFPWAYFRNFLSLFKARIPLKNVFPFLRMKNRATAEALFGIRKR